MKKFTLEEYQRVHSSMISGQVYVLTIGLRNPVGFFFPKGSTITLVEPTGQDPHGFVESHGPNWIAIAANGRTVWSSIPQGILEGYYVLKSSASH